MIGRGFFVTGTDTGAGKTVVSVLLLRALRAAGCTALAMKPVAAGCESTAAGLRNEDVEALRAAASFAVAREAMNPYAFVPPISPHLAASQAGVAIDFGVLREKLDALRQQADVVLVEGAGGWYAPVSDSATMADLAQALALPVVLIVGLRLGCLNHALLSAEAIARSSLPYVGWIGNCIDPDMAMREENLATLAARLPVPLLGVVPYLDKPGQLSDACSCLDITSILAAISASQQQP